MDFVTWSSKVNPISEESENTNGRFPRNQDIGVFRFHN
jgi:hypothetical protein